MNRVWQVSSAASSANRSSATGSRSMAIRVPAEPIRSAIRRAWPPPPKVQSTATSPGRGSITSISSPARPGMWLWVMSRRVAKARCQVGGTFQDLHAVAAVCRAVEHLQALPRAGDDDVLAEIGVVQEQGRDHHAVGGVELGVVREVE